jgi:hypothetical protein
MASKKTVSVKSSAAVAPKKAVVKKAPKGPKVKLPPTARHPKERVTARHGGKADLAKALAGTLAHGDQDAGQLATRLGRASNQQLLRLQRATETLKQRFGNRDKLIAAIGESKKKSTDKDYLAKLATYSLPQLLDMAPRGPRA